MTAICSAMVKTTAPRRGRLDVSPWRNSESRSERIASTCASCESVSTVNAIVRQCAEPSRIAHACANRVSAPIRRPTHSMCCHMPCAKTLSCGGRGGRRMTPRSSGSAASASPGRPSVTRFTHRMWIGSSGIGRPTKGARKIVQISPELPAITNRMNLRMLS